MSVNERAIRVEGLSKQYRLGGKQRRANTLRDTLANAFVSPFRRLGNVVRGQAPSTANSDFTIWALKDVSFDVKRGEVLGIIGRNGAGKSTLLKILSCITEPTEGRAIIRGRVGSLLDVGTGFHSELTGRENIYLSGSILGMKRAEIDLKFDQIVDFSGVETFLDTPVKHFSSGMYVRLAFAVAAHLQPEILMVDEVLAVGDIDFQKKCIGSMQTVANRGKTVLVVSHNLALIESLCSNAIWIDEGKIKSIGRPLDVVADYVIQSQTLTSENLLDYPRRIMDTTAKFARIQILTPAGDDCRQVKMGDGFILRLKIEAKEPIQKPWIGIQIRTSFNQLLFHIANREAGYELQPLHGTCSVNCYVEKLNLLPDRYFIDLILADMSNTIYDQISSAAYFDVRPADVLNTGMPLGKDYGLVFFATKWEVSRENDIF